LTHLSTSRALKTSSDRIADLPWGRFWAGVLVLFAVLLGAWELALRGMGFRQGAAEIESWVDVRSNASPEGTIFVGSSRIRAAIDPDVWQDLMGGPLPLQLAVPSGTSIPILEHLAKDPAIRGLVLVEIVPLQTFDASVQSGPNEDAVMAAYEAARKSPAQRSEAALQNLVSDRLVARNGAVSLGNVVSRLLSEGSLPRPVPVRFHRNRFSAMHFAEVWDKMRAARKAGGDRRTDRGFASTGGRPANPEELARRIERLNGAARAIEERGGEVIFVSLPACGERARIEEQRYPRAEYWDRLVASTPFRTVNVADVPTFTVPDCYDESHMDLTDARVFTRELVDLIRGE
jgi:hypothetical protein